MTFTRADTRLPEIALDFTRQELFNTGIFYWGNTTYGIYEEKIPPKTRRLLEDQANELERQIAGVPAVGDGLMPFNGAVSASLASPTSTPSSNKRCSTT